MEHLQPGRAEWLRLGVYVGSTLVVKVDLRGATTLRQVLLILPAFSYRTGAVTIRTLVSGKTVQIDGIGTSRI